MNRIISRKNLSEELIRFEISTSVSVREIRPGQYLVFKTDEKMPGIPLPVIKTNAERGTVITLASASEEGSATLSNLPAGSSFLAVSGPYGYAARVESLGSVLCIGREGGIAALVPILSTLRAADNRVSVILSAASAREMPLEDEIRAMSDELTVITDDGSYGEKSDVCPAVGQAMRRHPIQEVMVMGGAKTIRDVFSITTKYQVPTQAVMYTGRARGKGTHGIFRVSICGNARSICVDGVNFNAYYSNFEELVTRFEGADQPVASSLKDLEKADNKL
ncbi:MAG TPA: hypothetical protein VFG54_09415 [Prolixibacteraceae bacterium]|nr:hypothetical protein [Prolixibacteraceae bacterium]